ncbi:DUF2878 domain-containing protein [Dokdonella sp.]|uniref:DUF2878 domain-containing protein n=1 Tax=Dokdonella sp. TaxID=2291710 RepID=UPI003783CCCB
MGFWANLLGYQAVWFAAVIGAARDAPWVGVGVAALFVALQLSASTERRSDLLLVLCALLVGIVLDGTLAGFGVLHYASHDALLPAPAWILAVWAAFAMTINHSFAFLRGRADWAVVLGAIGGPLAYLGAARGFGAVVFAAPAWHAVAMLAFGWAIALPLLALLAQRWHRRSRPVGLQGAAR